MNSDQALQESRRSFEEELGHYEPPLVQGGQGRTGEDVANSALFICLMFIGAVLVAVALGFRWFGVALGGVVVLVAIVGSLWTAPVEADEPNAHIDIQG